MGHVAVPLAELTAQAQSLTSVGDLVGARAILADVLDPADAADPQRATADLAVAAALHARILIALGDPHSARLWAGFAHAAEERLHGPHDERTHSAAATHAAVLHRVGNYGRAAQVYHDLVLELINRDGPDSQRVLAAQADLATAEHAAGHCTAARARLTEAFSHHRRVHGAASPPGIKMLARLGAMERECGRLTESREHLAMAQELCARFLPDDHPLGRQIAALAEAPASGQHQCGRVAQSTGPESGVTPIYTAPAPGVQAIPLPAALPRPGDLTGRHARTEAARPLPGDDRPTEAVAEQRPVVPAQRQPPTEPPPSEGTADTNAVPTEPSPAAEAGQSADPPPPWAVRPPPAEPPVFGTPPADPPVFGAPPADPLRVDPPPVGAPDLADPMAVLAPPPQHRPAETSHPDRPVHTGDPPPAGPEVLEPVANALDEPTAELPEVERQSVSGPPTAAPERRVELPPREPPLSGPPGPWAGPGGPPLPGSAAAGPWRVEAGAEPVRPMSPSPSAGSLRPPPSHDSPSLRPIPARGTQDHATGVFPVSALPPARPGPMGWQPRESLPPPPVDLPSPHPEVIRELPDRRLPVPVERPRKRSARQPLLLLAVLVAGLLIAGAAVFAAVRRGPGPKAAPAATTAAPSVPAAPAPSAADAGQPPQNVKLRDNRDSVSVTWTYPKGAEGPVLISGGRQGQEQRAFQQLPAGTTDYVVYGLNNGQDYCFTVAVVYTVDRVAASPPVCTTRK
jgi:hypothetical protein